MNCSEILSLLGEILIFAGTIVLFFQFEEREDIMGQEDDDGIVKPCTVLFKNKKIFGLGLAIFITGELILILSYFV